MHVAAINGRADALSLLLEEGCNPWLVDNEQKTVIDHVIINDDVELFKMMYKPKKKWKPTNAGECHEIHTAACVEESKILKLLMSIKVDDLFLENNRED